MIKEELEKEAKDWIEANTRFENCPPWGNIKMTPSGYKSYLAAAEPREKRIADLEKQIKKLDEGCDIIEELSKFINDCKWYCQHGYEEKQKELIEKVNNFLEECQNDKKNRLERS